MHAVMSKPVRLTEAHKPLIVDHLINLSLPDRYMRFCSALSNSALGAYVDQLEMKKRDAVYGIIDIDNKRIVGVLHVASVEGDTAEFALSVDSDRRKQGIGDVLFERGLLHCESIGVNRVYMQCLASNQAIKRMASKRNMSITTDYGESIARLSVDGSSDVTEWLKSVEQDTIALYDLNCKFTQHQWESYVDEVKKLLLGRESIIYTGLVGGLAQLGERLLCKQ